MIEIQQYIDRHGRCMFDRWFVRLNREAQARVTTILDRLRQGGLAVKGVGAGVMELRLDFGPGYRIYLGKDGEALVILLTGGTKNRQQADIEAARELWQEYKQRKQEE